MSDTEHRTRVEELPEGFQMICSCGYLGKPRASRFDAGEDEFAHQQTGAGPRKLQDILDEERAAAEKPLAVRMVEAIKERRN